MDAYLASRELAEASHFYLNINFEILNGCKFKCRGCHVEKNAQQPISTDEFNGLSKLLQNFEQSLYRPFIAFVGPTDFLSADNFVSTFESPEIIKLFHHFKRVSLQTTYLDISKAELAAKILKEHYSEIELEINIVVDPARIMDASYLSILEKNKMKFMELLERDEVRTFGIMNVYNYDQTKIPDLLRDYDFMHQRVEHLFETTIDYNFSMGRNKDLSNEEFLDLTFRIRDLFNSSIVSDDKAEYLRFSFGKLTDSLIERQYNYRNGKLYYSPLLYERFVTFKDEFEVPVTQHTAREIEEYEMKVQLEQYEVASSMDECESCTFLGSCVDRGILFLMNTYKTKKCLVAKKALFAVNSMGALPINNHE
ncbi:MAG: hypothetical protein JNM24_15480 [Bdellovibrionaceae bacterium]|jgi:hypothetical protein|nr:hypothetical protein [Pseudobdellovibrionaceae bacterium]